MGILLRVAVLPACLASFAGCTSVGEVLKSREDIPFKAFPANGEAAIYLWPPYTSAAIVDKNGNRCVLAASGAQTVEATADAAIKAGDLFGKIANLDAQSKQSLVEAFKQISAADSRASFADIALFHLCLLDQNGTFKAEHMASDKKGPAVLSAYRLTVQEAAKLAK